MKSIIQRIQYIIVIGLFGFVAVTPVYAKGFPFFGNFFGSGENKHQEVNEATASPKPTFPPRNGFRDGDNIGTHAGIIKPKLLTRAVISMGQVTAINGTSLTVLGKDGKTYTIQTDGKTQFRRWRWGTGSFSEIQVNDWVSVIGQWTDDAHTTIQAKLIRDVSIQKFAGVFIGTIQSLASSGWVMTTVERGNQTVTVSSSTKFINRKGQTILQSDIAVGHRVRVRGLWDRTNSTITEVKEVKDFSLPFAPTGTVAPTPTVTPTPTAVLTPTATPTP